MNDIIRHLELLTAELSTALFYFALIGLTVCGSSAQSEELRRSGQSGHKTESFDAEPDWESYRNRLVPNPAPMTRQDFGYRSTTKYAGGIRPGEIGGWVQRSTTPAYYAKQISPKTLNDKIKASGKFSVTQDSGSSGTLIGWFNQNSRGWRTPNSLGFRIDGNGGKYWVFFEYGTQHWLTGGMGCFEGEQYQKTKTKPFPADGSVHTWSLEYDPVGANGNGQITYILDGNTYTLALAPGHKLDGATFNRFGIWNAQTTGSGLEVYLDDLVIDGEQETFDNDPQWEAIGNETKFEDRALRPLHDFGWSNTKFAGGGKGELGGIIWRDEAAAYYAAKTGKLTLNDELFASGKLVFTGAGSDSGVYLGWFDARSKHGQLEPEYVKRAQNYLAIVVEGPSRIGHYFRAGYSDTSGAGVIDEQGPIIRPDSKVHEWSLHYSPNGANGNGQIITKLDNESRTLDIRSGIKQTGATFDRFGLFNIQAGGHFVNLYLDNLTYTSSTVEVEKADR